MTLTDMIALVRKDLHDEDSGNYRWTDLTLTRHIAHAVKEFSEAVPLQSKATLATSSGSREVSLTSLTGRVMVEAVEYPVGQFPALYPRFSLWGDTLILLGENIPDGSNCYVYYGQTHTLGATSTIPAVYEDLITWGACGYAAIEWALYTINRVNNGGDAGLIIRLGQGKAADVPGGTEEAGEKKQGEGESAIPALLPDSIQGHGPGAVNNQTPRVVSTLKPIDSILPSQFFQFTDLK
jgi:hypothetical protein